MLIAERWLGGPSRRRRSWRRLWLRRRLRLRARHALPVIAAACPRASASLALALALATSTALAAPPEPLVAQAKWIDGGDGRPRILAPLAGVLTEKQRSMIEGGFTTVTQVSLKLPIAAADADGGERERALQVFYSLRCSVKFDAWEEIFEAARLDDQRPGTATRTAVLKTYDDFGALCLTVDLDDDKLVARLAPEGGVILAYLVAKQTSPEEAGKIRDWLIQQQSGVMQGLFSHMLGELTLAQTIRVRIDVPPRPVKPDHDPRVKTEPRPTKPARKG
jgi:hypothetical protein